MLITGTYYMPFYYENKLDIFVLLIHRQVSELMAVKIQPTLLVQVQCQLHKLILVKNQDTYYSFILTTKQIVLEEYDENQTSENCQNTNQLDYMISNQKLYIEGKSIINIAYKMLTKKTME